MDTDEMGNEVETFEVWHVECVYRPASMYPSIGSYRTLGEAESMADYYRTMPEKWACVRVTGPHQHYRPKHDAVFHGPREAVAADFGIAA